MQLEYYYFYMGISHSTVNNGHPDSYIGNEYMGWYRSKLIWYFIIYFRIK